MSSDSLLIAESAEDESAVALETETTCAADLDAGPCDVAAPALDACRPTRAGGVIRGSLWTLGGFGAGQALRLVGNVIVSRLVSPEAFGLMALVNVFIQGLGMSCDLGIEPNVIQSRRGDEPAFLNTAWTLQVLRGFALLLGACLLGWPVALFYDEPRFLWLIPLVGIATLLAGFNSTAIYSARRHLLLGRVASLELASQIAGLTVMCVGAWLAPGVGALAAGVLVQAAIVMFGSHALRVGPRNRFRWEPDAARSLFHFGKWIFVSTLITFFAMQVDRLALGKLIPLESLGVYSVAAALAMLPYLLIAALSGSVLYPLLARHARQSPADLGPRLAEAREPILMLAMTLTLGLILGAPQFFALLYDARYQQAGELAQLLSATVWITALSTTLDRALQALGDSRSVALFNLAKLIASTGASIAGYYLAGVSGFIGGLAVGGLFGQVVLHGCLRAHGINAAGQDVRYSALMALFAFGALGLTRLADAYLPGRSLPVTVGLLVIVAAWGLWRAKRQIPARSASE